MRPARSTTPARPRISRVATVVAAAALIAACGTDADTDDDAAEPPADEQTAPDEGDMDDLDDLLGGGDEDLDLPDPNEHLDDDGVFRGIGVMLPTPEGWQLDEMSYAQGQAVALTPDGMQALVAIAVDTTDLPEDQQLDYDQLLEENRADLGGEPSVDEEVDVAGADRAHQLRFDDVPAQQEGQPESTALLVLADDGAGQLAIFNYVAPSDEFDEDTASLLLAESGFDPDSDPSSPIAG